MTVDLWISILLAVPLAILANLVTPKIKEWFDRRAERRAKEKKKQTIKELKDRLVYLQKEIDQLDAYNADSKLYFSFLLEVLIKATMYGALAALYSGLSYAVGQWIGTIGSMSLPGQLDNWLFLGGQISALLGSMLVFTVCWSGFKVIRKINKFDEYKAESNRRIESINVEIETQQGASADS